MSAVQTQQASSAAVGQVRAVVEAVPDPEVPVPTIGDLGIVRDVRPADDGAVEVDLTPTYSGCPAVEAITDAVARAVREHGHDVRVRKVLSPAWTTDWMSDEGRRKLAQFGISPPGKRSGGSKVAVSLSRTRPTGRLECPHCGSCDTEELARFGSTACKALWRCTACGEPFDHFKAI
ncbi:MAG: 1,2-phenylacetyl-CoA epoxidase subunit PaaD [Actinomycetes bacterium]